MHRETRTLRRLLGVYWGSLMSSAHFQARPGPTQCRHTGPSERGRPRDLLCGLVPASDTDRGLGEDRALWSEVQGLSGGPRGGQHRG